jgi:hypothetical protein
MHGGGHEAIDKHCAGFLVDFVFDRRRVHRNFDDHIEIIGHIAAGGDSIEVHGDPVDVYLHFPATRHGEMQPKKSLAAEVSAILRFVVAYLRDRNRVGKRQDFKTKLTANIGVYALSVVSCGIAAKKG